MGTGTRPQTNMETSLGLLGDDSSWHTAESSGEWESWSRRTVSRKTWGWGCRLSAGRWVRGGGVQGTGPVIQKRVPQTSGSAFTYLPAGIPGTTAEAFLWGQEMDTCLNQPKGPVSANYQLTPSLKINAIFLAPHFAHFAHFARVGRAPGRGLILAGQGETEFPER